MLRGPFLYSGVMRSSLQSEGTVAVSSEVWNIVVSIGAISSATMIRSLVGMLSGPEALCGLRCLRSLVTPRVEMMRGFMDGILINAISGIFVRFSLV